MKLLWVLMVLAGFVMAQPVPAQGGPPNGKGPIGRLQAAVEELASQIGSIGGLEARIDALEELTERIDEIDGLTARTEALEGIAHAAPDDSVALRTYCRRTIGTVLIGNPVDPNRLRKTEFLQEVSFIPHVPESPETGMVAIGPFTIRGGILQKSDFVILFGPARFPSNQATYEQAGTRIDVTFSDEDVLTLYGSKDGSLLHGTNVLPGPNPGEALILETHFVEIDGIEATCGDEG